MHHHDGNNDNAPSPAHLTPEQIDNFLSDGYLRVPGCFSRAQAAEWTSGLWTRLGDGFDPADKSTWGARERVYMPPHKRVEVRSFAPKAWTAICDLLGGEGRVSTWSTTWPDAFIVNLGSKEAEARWARGAGDGKRKTRREEAKELYDWHVDGDWFVHYLDSPEQALLVVPLFSDIVEDGGGTMVCPDAIGEVARHLYNHPEGVDQDMVPLNQPPPTPPPPPSSPSNSTSKPMNFCNSLARSCTQFEQLTGDVGDVILLHPLMLHSSTKNPLHRIRVIINSCVSARQPLNFDRADPAQYSPVERKTLRELRGGGGEQTGLKGWMIEGQRRKIVPERERVWERVKSEEEEERLRAAEGEVKKRSGKC